MALFFDKAKARIVGLLISTCNQGFSARKAAWAHSRPLFQQS